jgi:hypothetical protein
MSPCSGTLSSNTTVRAGRRPPFDIPERRSHRRDYRRIKEVQFKRDYTRALHGLAGGPCICRSIWRQDGRSFSGWYAPVLVGKWENSGGSNSITAVAGSRFALFSSFASIPLARRRAHVRHVRRGRDAAVSRPILTVHHRRHRYEDARRAFLFSRYGESSPDGARADPGAHPRWPRDRPVRRTRRGPKAPDDRRQGSGRPKAIGKRDAAQRGGAQLRRVGSYVISMGASLFADVRARARASRFGHCQYDRQTFETIHFVISIFWKNVSRSCQILINFGRAYPSQQRKDMHHVTASERRRDRLL